MNHGKFRLLSFGLILFILYSCNEKGFFNEPEINNTFSFKEKETTVSVDKQSTFFELIGKVKNTDNLYVTLKVVPEYTTAIENEHYVLPQGYYEEDPWKIALSFSDGTLEKSARIKINGENIITPVQIAFTHSLSQNNPINNEQIDTTVIKLVPVRR